MLGSLLRRGAPLPERVLTRLDGVEALDQVATPIHSALEPIAASPVGAVLRGRWLGHAAHPVLTDVPIGCWTSAWLIDLFGGPQHEDAARAFIGLGVIAAIPTVVTGWADWVGLPAEKRRTGVVHAGTNAVATALYAASWRARRAGDHRRGVRLAHAGAALATAGGFLGGHLAFG